MNSTITRKVTLFGILLVITTIVSLGTIYSVKSDKEMRQSFEDKNKLLMNNVEFSINNFTTQLEHIIGQVEKSNSRNDNSYFSDKSSVQDQLDGIKATYSGVLNIYFAYEDGSCIVSPKKEIQLGSSNKRSWYMAAINSAGNVWSKPYIDGITGKNVITVSKAIYKDNKLIGVLGIDFAIDSLISYVSNVNLGDTGYIVLVDSDYKIIAGQDRRKHVGSFINDSVLKKSIESAGSNPVLITINGEGKYCYYSKCTKVNWIVIGLVDQNEMLEHSRDVLNIIIISSIIILIFAVLVGRIVTRKITRNLKNLSENMKNISTGDLVLRLDEEGKDETAIIASHINPILDKLNYIIDSSDDAVWEYDVKKDKLIISEKFTLISGYETVEKEYNFDSFIQLIHKEDLERVSKGFYDLIKRKIDYYEDEFKIKRLDDSYIWLNVKAKAVYNKSNFRLYGSLSDITVKKIHEEHVIKHNYYDKLTGLPNRRYFEEELKVALEEAKENNTTGAVILLDIDHFKNINDTLSHRTGDLLLKEVARSVFNSRFKYTFSARLGGDEFLLLIRKVENIDEITQMIQENLKTKIYIEGKSIVVSSSAGVVCFPQNGDDVEQIIRNADIAMYIAKEKGRNRVVKYDNYMFESFNRKILIEQELREINCEEELEVYYQAQMDLEECKLRGYEALLRWNSPILGAVSPSEFIPISEKTGSIVSIGQWLIYKVFKDVNELRSKNIDFHTVSINISAVQLLDKSFLDTVKDALYETEIDPNFIEFEITETAVINNMEYSNAVLKSLKDLGFKIVLDDFGTGYSSLSYLKMLPIEVLKIDKSFIDDINSTDDNKALLFGIIKIAHDLRMKVIAEGVETRSQLQYLKDIQCDIVQGYYFSKPISYKYLEQEYKRLSNINTKNE